MHTTACWPAAGWRCLSQPPRIEKQLLVKSDSSGSLGSVLIVLQLMLLVCGISESLCVGRSACLTCQLFVEVTFVAKVHGANLLCREQSHYLTIRQPPGNANVTESGPAAPDTLPTHAAVPCSAASLALR